MTEAKPIPAVRCAGCGAAAIPPQYCCRQCGQTAFEPIELPGCGTVYTHTTIRVAPETYRDQVPYTIAIVELEPRLRLTARILTKPGIPISIGECLCFERLDANGYWFRPVVD